MPPCPEVPANGEPSRIRGLRGYRDQLPTSALADEILTPGEGQVRALVCLGGNPVVAWPDHDKTIAAPRDLELLVVHDHRLTATAELATHVVAAKLPLERADVTHVMDKWFELPCANHSPAILAPAGDVVSEWELVWHVARRLGTPVELPGGPLPLDRRPSDDEVLDLVSPHPRVPLAALRANGGGRVYPELVPVVAPAEPGASARFTVAPADIVAELAAVAAEPTTLCTLPGYDPEVHTHRLVSRRLKGVLNSLGPELPGRARVTPLNHAYLHPDDLAALGPAGGDVVDLESPRATIRAVAAAAADVRPGVVSMAHGWRDAPTNRLVDNEHGFDPVTGQAGQSAIPVHVRRTASRPAGVAAP